ncbi:unnamed protein product [Arabis nemorensis]|uniref:Uncharacterized protein n=1 Tax=Arabis nemorensis TaxID=586526 RepID=A0A565BEI9_9BRAS|nr:unnamed protein product [Arabis nemorensis]
MMLPSCVSFMSCPYKNETEEHQVLLQKVHHPENSIVGVLQPMRLTDQPHLRPVFEHCPASHQTQLLCLDALVEFQGQKVEFDVDDLDREVEFDEMLDKAQTLDEDVGDRSDALVEFQGQKVEFDVDDLDREVEFDEMLDKAQTLDEDVGDRSDALVEFQGQKVEFDVDDLDREVEFDEMLDKAQTLDEDVGDRSDALVEELQQLNFQDGEPSVGEPSVGEINTSSTGPPYKTRSGRVSKLVDKFSPSSRKTKSRKL